MPVWEMVWLDNFFLNIKGLYALLVLAPFILLYIIRPKPKKVIIPSLMFFIKDKSDSNFNSFLQKFFSDLLFYIQFIVLLLLALTVAKPFMVVPSISYADSMVFVIDASASMNAREDGMTRFERALEAAEKRIQGRNSIILATDQSQLVLEDAGPADTEKELEALKCRETPSANFYDSIVLAENFAKGDSSAVFVISDFSSDSLERDFLRAKLYLESKGIDVFFEDISLNKARNIGIIDLEIKDGESTAWIKNFDTTARTVTIAYGDKKSTVSIEPNDVIAYSFTTIAGKSKLEIDADDDLKLDNYAYISTPEDASIDILMITNTGEKYLKTALDLMNKVSVDIETPPIVNFNNPDLIILGDINEDVMIPGDINKVKDFASENGVPVVIMAQDNILKLNLGTLMPLELEKKDPIEVTDVRDSYNILPTQPDSYLTPTDNFGQTKKIYATKPNENVITYAYSMQNDYPVIALYNYGIGKVMFYGIFDEYSDFKADITYPVFWKRAIDLLIGGRTISELNKQTGYLQALGKEQSVVTPQGNRKGKLITLDYTGFYDFPEYTVAANLISEEEQRLVKDKATIENSKLTIEADKIKNETKDRDITYIMVAIATAFLIIELLFIKIRGDL